MRIDFDGATNTITINGVLIALEVLEMMTDPDPRACLRFERIGEVIIAHKTMTDEPIGIHREAT